MMKVALTIALFATLAAPTQMEYHSDNTELQVWEVVCDSGPQSYLDVRKRSITDEVLLCEEIDSIKHFVIRPDKVKRKVNNE